MRRIAAGEPYVLRIKVPEDRGDVVVRDAVHGDVTFAARELDDFVIQRTDGTPTYNFATVVDDAAMGITHVIRGDDHLSNTPRQVIVYEALGAPVPTFAHISMILGADGKKLSKRHGATNVEEYHDAGYLSDAFVNYLALLGWSLDGETTIIPRDVLGARVLPGARLQEPGHLRPQEARLDPGGVHPLDERPGVRRRGHAAGAPRGRRHRRRLRGRRDLGGRARRHREAAHEVPRGRGHGDRARSSPPPRPWSTTRRAWPRASPRRAWARSWTPRATRWPGSPRWEPAAIDAALEPLPEALDLKKRLVFQAVRVAVCGNMVSPPLGETMALVGREDCLARIDRARAMAL